MGSRVVVGQILGHYRILQRLGAGGMGEVYRARDVHLERDVAIKILPPENVADPVAKARLLREARTASQLNHPNICTIHEVGEADGQTFIAMELVAGEALSTKLQRGPLETDLLLRYTVQLAEALAHAHGSKVVHRDLKSANVMITPEGRVKVLDFGLAERIVDRSPADLTASQFSLTEPGEITGTLGYMAPEQLRGRPADARSDVWALGVVMYEMATGRMPFQGTTSYELSAAILSGRPAPLPAGVPEQLRTAVDRCLEKDSGRRYRDSGELLIPLHAAQQGTVQHRHTRTFRRWLGAAASLSVGIALVIVTLLLGPHSPGSRRQIHSLAVLPLENLSGSADQQYIAEGVHEELITALGRLTGLQKVTARASTLAYARTDKSPASIAGELGVDALITGAVQRSGDRLRLTAHLIDPATGEQLWTGQYDSQVRDVLAMEDEIVSTITRQIDLKLTSQEKQQLATAHPVDAQAYDAYLQGLFHLHRRSAGEVDLALQYFQRAVDRDPNYADAWAGIAQVWGYRHQTGLASQDLAALKIRNIVQKALSLDPSSAQVHLAMADINAFIDFKYAEADAEFQRAILLGPNDPDVRSHYGVFLSGQGRLQDAEAQLNRAEELDPFTGTYHGNRGAVLMDMHRYDEAIAEFKTTLSLNADAPNAHRGLMVAYYLNGMEQQSIAEGVLQYRQAEADPATAAAMQRGYERGGFKEGMRQAAQSLADSSQHRPVRPYFVAVLYRLSGDDQRALEWLRKPFGQRRAARAAGPVSIREPLWDSLRSDPRFVEIVRDLQQGR